MLKFASVVKDGDSGSILSLDSDSILSVDSDSSMTPQDGWGKEESAFAYDKSIPGGGMRLKVVERAHSSYRPARLVLSPYLLKGGF